VVFPSIFFFLVVSEQTLFEGDMIATPALAGGLLLLLVLTQAAGASLLCDPIQKRLSHTILVAQFAAPIGPRSSLMSPPADLPTLVRKV
jgi:hypothetical protein